MKAILKALFWVGLLQLAIAGHGAWAQNDAVSAEECACLVPPLRITTSRKRAGESDIVDRIEIRDEIETLENAANIVCSKLVSLFGGHLVQALVQYGDVSAGARQ